MNDTENVESTLAMGQQQEAPGELLPETDKATEEETFDGYVLEGNLEEEDNDEANTPSYGQLPPWYPIICGKPVYHGNREALGWGMDATGRAVSFISAASFLGTALIRLAKEQVGCATDPPPGSNRVPPCNARVFGIFRPSSLLTTYTVIVGVVSATMLPFMGALVDYSPNRRLIGRCLSATFCVLLFPQIFVSSKTWFAVAILQLLVAFVGWAQTLVTHAYLPELTRSEERLNQYVRSYTVLGYGSMVVYITGVVLVSSALGLGDVSTAQLGQAVAFVVSAVFLYAAWGELMQKRPAANSLPDGRSLWTAGFVRVYRTSIYISRNYSALKWCYISIACGGAAIQSLGTIMITYLTDTMDFTSSENGIAILVVLVGSIPGAYLASAVTRLLNPISSLLLNSALLAINTVAAAIVLKGPGPGQKLDAYILAFVWGLGTGWKWTSEPLLVSAIIPEGQDAELMGIYLFAGQVLTWLPPLIFTGLNEAGVSQRIGIGVIAVFLLLDMGALLLMGPYADALALAGRIQRGVLTEEAASPLDQGGRQISTVESAGTN